jgi:hypothetical protein
VSSSYNSNNYDKVYTQVMEILPLASFATTVTMSLHINEREGRRGEDTHRMIAAPNHSADTPFNSITTSLTKIASDDVRPPSSQSVKCLWFALSHSDCAPIMLE